MARIISIVNQKEGTGKSACTANLAVGLAQKNAVTATQKTILDAFGLNEGNVRH